MSRSYGRVRPSLLGFPSKAIIENAAQSPGPLRNVLEGPQGEVQTAISLSPGIDIKRRAWKKGNTGFFRHGEDLKTIQACGQTEPEKKASPGI
jgi:hypothetical protein